MLLGSLTLDLYTALIEKEEDWSIIRWPITPPSLLNDDSEQQQQQHRSLPLGATPSLVSSKNERFYENNNRVVHYMTTEYTGWNNQREAAMMAWVIAYQTGFTLQLKNFHPAFTGAWSDRGGYQHGDLWDLSLLSKFVNITLISYDRTAAVGYEHEVTLEDRFETAQEVAQLAQQYQSISYACGWSFLQHQLPWLTPDHLLFPRMLESFTYNSFIQETAAQVVRQIQEKDEGQPQSHKNIIIALHVRQNRRPAVDCREWGLETILNGGNHMEKYQRGGCLGLHWHDPRLVEWLFPDHYSNATVYLAHDGSLGGALPEGYRQASDFDMVKTLRPAIVSAVEQEIAIRADYFVASTHSSWSEYVVYKRMLLNKEDGRKNYDIWVRNLDIMDPPRVPNGASAT